MRALTSARLGGWLLAPALLASLGAASAPGAGQGTCTTSAQYGDCYYAPYNVNQDMWNPGPGSTQTLTAESAGNWKVSTYQPGGAFVRSYPNVSEDFGQPISDFTTAVATFADQTPAKAKVNAAFDIWVDGSPGTSTSAGTVEVMVWTRDQGTRPAGSKIATVTIGGQKFIVWQCKAGDCFSYAYYAFQLNHDESSGQAHLLASLRWLIRRGLIPASDPLTEVDYGWEIRETNGATLTFAMTSYRLKTALDG